MVVVVVVVAAAVVVGDVNATAWRMNTTTQILAMIDFFRCIAVQVLVLNIYIK